ncbi:UDP-glucosyltransferase 2-like isoform X2 [Homalodisca vitripennis]|nr:UDP-glucosyltransferase 2-like isoform X2 [Homalodisca vitripennis]
MAALAEREHQITVLGVDEPKIQIPNITTFVAGEVYNIFNIDFSDYKPGWLEQLNIGRIYPGFQFWDESASKRILHSSALQNVLNRYKNIKKPFDLIIHDNVNAQALLGLVHLFGNPPLILATTFSSPQWMTFRAGNIFNPAYIPSMITCSGQYMTFYERFFNTFNYVFLEWYQRFVSEPFQDRLMKEVLGPDLPHVRDIAKQANIIIVNHHFALNGPRPMLPGVIELAGLHITEPKPLPKDIKDFMDGAEHGVIMLSFGSNVDSTWLPRGFENVVLAALRQLRQRVLWKWDKDLPDIPPNVKLSKWLPQGDIFVHPKLRLFVTHCGLLSVQEAIYRKVPMLALPLYIDQIDNAALLVRHNLSIQLNVYNLNADQLRDGIMEILSNPVYKRNTERMGNLMTDMPLTSKQQAVFWSEYAIRHQGAPHLRSAAADMSWIQLLMLDVIGTAFLILLIVLWAVKTVLLFFLRRFVFSTSKSKVD